MSLHPAILERAQELLGYRFKDPELLCAALTHPSATEGATRHSYERLEFLGDSILGATVAWEAFERYPQLAEGGLTRIKVALVSGDSLARVAADLGLGELIIFGHSETGTGKRGLHSALENVYEALVAALTLDGGFAVARAFVARTLLPFMDVTMADEPENPKSTLQELLQEHRVTPTYDIVETLGPPHDRTFVARALAADVVLASGAGRTKKEAEAVAARAALDDYDGCLARVLEAVDDLHREPEAQAAVQEVEQSASDETPDESGCPPEEGWF